MYVVSHAVLAAQAARHARTREGVMRAARTPLARAAQANNV